MSNLSPDPTLATTALYVETTFGVILLAIATLMVIYSLAKNKDIGLVKLGLVAGVVGVYVLINAG